MCSMAASYELISSIAFQEICSRVVEELSSGLKYQFHAAWPIVLGVLATLTEVGYKEEKLSGYKKEELSSLFFTLVQIIR